MYRTLLIIAIGLGLALPSTAATPAHLKALPPGVLEHGRAPSALAKAEPGARVALWLPGGERTLEVERKVQGLASTTSFGRIAGVGRAAITLGAEGGFGRVTEGTTVWFLEYRGGEAWAVRAGETGLAIAADDAAALGQAPRAQKLIAMATPSPIQTVDVAALYDADFAARYPGGLAATRIDHQVALANQAFVDSEVAVTLRVVQASLAAGAVQPGIGANVSSMRAAVQSSGSFAGVDLNALRANTGADLISFFRVHDLYLRGACGIAYFPGAVGQFWYGVNVVVDGESAGSICDDYVFAHEVGHNLGAGHQTPDAGFFASSHAFVRLGQFNTIMGSFGTGSADRFRRLGYFSNPQLACGGMPCGVAGASDNAGTMNALRGQVAGYTASLGGIGPTRPAPFDADSDGDSASDRVDAFPFDALESLDADGDGQPASRDAFPMNASEWRDTDGGGLGDNADPDDDNDGYADAIDAFPLLQSEHADADGDGTGDVADAFDADPSEQRDTDHDGIGDRADTDDDSDGVVDVATLAAPGDGELLVADGATDRILRFDGATLAPLGTLVQLAPAEVTVRSGMAGAPSGELYFVGGSVLRRLDRLRSASALPLVATYDHPDFTTGFPASPVVSGKTIAFAEWGQAVTAFAYMQDRADGLSAVHPNYLGFILGSGGAYHLAPRSDGAVMALDGASGDVVGLDQDPSAPLDAKSPNFFQGSAIPAGASASFAISALDRLFWVDRRDGALRNWLFPSGSGAAVPDIAGADARAVTLGPDGLLYVAKRSGGVQKYDAVTGADLGVVLTAAAVAEPLALTWAPRILDASMPALAAPPALVVSADPTVTPPVGGPPVVTNTGGGGGGAPDPALLALLLAALYARRGFTSSSARTARASSSQQSS